MKNKPVPECLNRGKETKELAAILLAAGRGERMKSSLPKVLHRICGRTLMERTAQLTLALPVLRKIVVVPPKADAIRKVLSNDFKIVVQEKALGTAHAVMAAQPLLKNFKGNVLVLCADVPLMTLETLKKFIEKHHEGHYYGTILTGKLTHPAGYGRIVRKGDDEVLKIVEDCEATSYEKAIEEINSGTYCFDWPSLEEVLSQVKMHPQKNELYLTDVVEKLVKNKKSISAYCVEDAKEILGINSRHQLAEAERILQLRIVNYWMDNGVTIIDPETTFIDENVRIGQDTVIHPFSVIEGSVTIGKNCVIGPFSRIRERTILGDKAEIGNFVEVKASRVGSGVKAKHLTYLGDATIGKGVNIGAGTITANYDGKNKFPTTIEEGSFIGSGTILIAPVRVGKNAVTGAGSVVTREHHVPDGATVIGVPARILKNKLKSGVKNRASRLP